MKIDKSIFEKECVELDTIKEYGDKDQKLGTAKMVNLKLNIGKDLNIKPIDVVTIITKGIGLPKKGVGDIRVFDKYTLLEIKKSYFDLVMTASKNKKFKGKKVKLSLYDDLDKPFKNKYAKIR